MLIYLLLSLMLSVLFTLLMVSLRTIVLFWTTKKQRAQSAWVQGLCCFL